MKQISLKLDTIDRLKLFFKGGVLWAVLLIMISIVVIFEAIKTTNLQSFQFIFSEVQSITTPINRIEHIQQDIDDGENNRFQFFYEFTWEKNLYRNSSFSDKKTINTGEFVVIEFVIKDPNVSRVKGMDTAENSLWFLILAMIFFFGILMFLLVSIKEGKHNLQIMKCPLVVYSTQISSVEDYDSDQFTLTYEYFINGKNYTNEFRTKKPSNFEIEEFLLIAENNPALSILGKDLPKSIKKKILNS